jgi:hypothetical protein
MADREIDDPETLDALQTLGRELRETNRRLRAIHVVVFLLLVTVLVVTVAVAMGEIQFASRVSVTSVKVD